MTTFKWVVASKSSNIWAGNESMSKTRKISASRPLVAYKGFDPGMYCRGYKFLVGKVHSIPDEFGISMCHTGFHACKNPGNVHSFYNPRQGNKQFAVVHQWGDVEICESGEKQCSRHIKIVKVLTAKEFIELSKLEAPEINKTKKVMCLDGDFELLVINKVRGAYIYGNDTSDVDVVTTSTGTTIAGDFATFKGTKGCTFISTHHNLIAKVDGRKIKANTKYKPTCRGFVKC